MFKSEEFAMCEMLVLSVFCVYLVFSRVFVHIFLWDCRFNGTIDIFMHIREQRSRLAVLVNI